MDETKGVITEISNYLKKNLKKGYTKDSLKLALLEQGYSRFQIEKAVIKAEEELSQEAPTLKTKPTIKYQIVEPRELAKTVIKEPEHTFWRSLSRKFFGI